MILQFQFKYSDIRFCTFVQFTLFICMYKIWYSIVKLILDQLLKHTNFL